MLYHNIGKTDRFLRVLLGLVLLGTGIVWFPNYILTFLMFLVGILALSTGIVGWAPEYSMFNYSTRRTGLNRITKKDIEKAVKSYVDTKESKALTTKKASTKKTSKKVAKKSTKKTTKKVVKKTTKKKSTTKKSTKKSVKKVTKKKNN